MSGLFIDVAIDNAIRNNAEMAQKLEDACPVDIYANEDGSVKVVEENLDECVLCELCVKAAPPGTVKVLKLYDGTALESQGVAS
jgi:NAD-dependent dihydropyrimidine dehydrogenase PreA subunit